MKKIDLSLVSRPEVTIIPNYIIDHDMLEANELQLKVYLYILRNTSAGLSSQISVMADHFNETEKDIERAVSFWINRGVFSSAANTTVTPDTESVSSTKPVPTREEFESAQKDLDFQELSFIAETYMGKTLSKSDLESLIFIKHTLNFSDSLIEFLIEYCAERGKKSFHYIQTVACAWAEQGITTPEEAKSRNLMFSQRIYSIMNALGKKTEPTNAELIYINRWYQQYAFESDVIMEACRRTVLATDKNRFSYADKILSSWFEAGVHHITDINRLDTTYRNNKTSYSSDSNTRKVPNYVANNPFLQHKQSDVDYNALEKALLQHS